MEETVLYFFTGLAVLSFTSATTTFSQHEEQIENRSEGNQPKTNYLDLFPSKPSFPSPARLSFLHYPLRPILRHHAPLDPRPPPFTFQSPHTMFPFSPRPNSSTPTPLES